MSVSPLPDAFINQPRRHVIQINWLFHNVSISHHYTIPNIDSLEDGVYQSRSRDAEDEQCDTDASTDVFVCDDTSDEGDESDTQCVLKIFYWNVEEVVTVVTKVTEVAERKSEVVVKAMVVRMMAVITVLFAADTQMPFT